jgi:hypothetical protein
MEGINDLVDQVKLPKNKVGWSHGMYPTDQKSMCRIPGKLLMGTSTSPGKVLTIAQLSFDSVDVVVRHSSTLLISNNDLSLMNSSSSSVSPLSGWMSP